MENPDTLVIDEGKILEFTKKGNVLRTDPFFVEHYINYRDPYYGSTPDPEDFEEIKRRDGNFMPYSDFMQLWEDSEKGVHLKITNFENPETVYVEAVSYTEADYQYDLLNPPVKRKIILKKDNFVQAKVNWDNVIQNERPFTFPKIALGAGANSQNEPVIFVQLSDDNFYTNETSSPILVPKPAN